MTWTIDNRGVSIQRCEKGKVRLISHLQYPFEDESANTVHKLVLAYLKAVQGLLELSNAALKHLRATIPASVDEPGLIAIADGLQLQWSRAFSIRDESVAVLIQQTHTIRKSGGQKRPEGLPVEFAGLRILIHFTSKGAQRITGAASSLIHEPIEVTRPVRQRPGGAFALSKDHVDRIHENFGLTCMGEDWESDIAPHRFIHRFQGCESVKPDHRPSHPPVVGQYYVANAIRVMPGGPGDHHPACDLVFRESDFAPLRADALVTHVATASSTTGIGLAFESDPVSARGDFNLRPNASPAALDRQRTLVELQHLQLPATDQSWTLSGKYVRVCDGHGRPLPGWIGVEPPSNQLTPTFAFRSRTNDFAAVNAYYHLDRMFVLLESIGLSFSSFPMRYSLPVQVIHRAAIRPGPCRDGKCVNAQAQVVCSHAGRKLRQTLLLCFALADLQRSPGSAEFPLEPLGIACDARVIWHEFCHVLIVAATDFLEFPFAHSAGDALAAINGDPDSRFAAEPFTDEYRGLTFPWGETPTRRHNREAANGWSWSSAVGRPEGYETDLRDMFGYAREQVLSTTLFRLYCAIGGDAKDAANNPDRAMRKAAALYATYLIIRAICSLGPRRTVPVRDAEAFAQALAEADIGTAIAAAPLDRSGGTVHKVIRWSFEKQGLWFGRPEPIDVFIEDGRNGEYQYATDWQARRNDVWNSTTPDPRGKDEAPLLGAENFIFVRVKNRGHMPATNVMVSVFRALAGQDTTWPSPNWTQLPLMPGTPESSDQATAQDALVFGPFVWCPDHPWSYSFLVQVDADGDLSNINPATSLPCVGTPTPLAMLVPLDNNIGLRTIDVP